MAPSSSALGGYHEVLGAARRVAELVFLGILCVTALLERLQFQLRTTESARWWASNGRDVVNAFALLTLSLGLHLLGFTGPMAFLLAGALVMVLTALQASLERLPHATLLSGAASLLMGAPLLLAPAKVDFLVRAGVGFLFP